ncbi:Calponin homology domain [Pseudocohnilembus persalinus]|uniref:Calponin homology domain n=1 Tax=Pseudocohnilembus persalinus TaxID=266149 RepID=A0A0V0QUB3_PSEPJ|nr:Calponin homology domain [Pseudocohnilembus persalinus]|eukprot:KRX05819.1 Calponin homology domain [Pseudocohnilembus persalinus]
MNQNQTIPREIIKWLDSLDLAYSVRNVRRDLQNGFIVAEILSRYFPKEISIYSFDNGLKLEKKKDNWEQISKFLRKKEFILQRQEYEKIYNAAPDVALTFLSQLYEFLTRKQLQTDKKPKIKQDEEIPSYAKPTALTLARDRELVRIVDNDEKKMRTQVTIAMHNDQAREEKQDSNIIEYLVLKRRAQLEEQLRQEEEQMLERKRKYNQEQTQQPEVQEIQIKSFKSSTSKKNKEQQGQLMETKGILENLSEISGGLLKKEFVEKAIRDLKLDKKQSTLVQLFNRFDEIKYEKQDDPNVIEAFLIHFQSETCIENIVEQLNNNFLDFKKFFHLFLRVLEQSPDNSKQFLYCISLFKQVAQKLCEIDPQTLQMMFESILMKELVFIVKKFPTKREQIIDTFYYFCAQDSLSRLHLIKKIKELLNTDMATYLSILSVLVTQDYGDDFDGELYQLFSHFAFQSLYSSSPFMRTNCLKIINEILYYSYEPILAKMHKLQKLIFDDWWEVKAQILIITANLLLYIAQSQLELEQRSQKNSPKNDSQNMEEIKSIHSKDNNNNNNNNNNSQDQETIRQQQEYLMNITLGIFRTQVSENILRIGLIYLAPVLNHYPQLCDRYLDILLEIHDGFREIVLTTDPVPGMEEGQIVRGYASFNYKLSEAPIIWNSVGIAKSLDKYTKNNQLEQFQRVHLDILIGCLYKQMEDADAQTWMEIYENISTLIFDSLYFSELCYQASDILKKIFLFESIQKFVLNFSFDLFSQVLQQIFHPDVEEQCKENLLQFFQFLITQNDIFVGYIFDIIKLFSEQNKTIFLKSNLIEFMNDLAKDRRTKMFRIDYLPK